MQHSPCCTLRGPGASILLDFGRELHGSLQIVTGPLGKEYSDSVQEVRMTKPSHVIYSS